MPAFKFEQVRVRRRDHANFALKSREKSCEIPGMLAHRAHKICVHSANVGCAKPQNLVAALHRVGSALKGKISIVTRRDHANLSAKVARNNCKFPGILARRAQRNCPNAASMRCVSRRTSLHLLSESNVSPNVKRCASGGRRCHAIFLPNSLEKNYKISGIPARRAHQKIPCTRPASAAHVAKRC